MSDFPRSVDTLIVFCTNRGDYILEDQIDALHWAHNRPHWIVAVDDTLAADRGLVTGWSPYGVGGHVVIPSRLVKGQTHLSGFKNFEAIEWAYRAGVDFKACLSVDDDAFPIGRGLDDWALPTMEATAIDLLGVQDRVSYQPDAARLCAALARWLPEAGDARWAGDAVTPQNIFFAMIWLSRPFCDMLRRRDLLVPDGYQTWPSWPDAYISLVAQLLGAYAVAWGHMDAPRAPLYANHRNHVRMAPEPRILHPDFLLYHPLRYVNHYDEATLRRYYEGARAASAAR